MATQPDAESIRAVLSEHFRKPVRVSEFLPLAGDASTRRYFRARLAQDAPLPSVIVMLYPDEIPPGGELPFVNVHRILKKAGVPVPEIHLSVPGSNLLFLEDAGDTMLETAVAGAKSKEEILPLYERCVEILVRIQSDGTHALDGDSLPARMAFDVEKFSWETTFFFEHAVRGYGNIDIPGSWERAIGDRLLPLFEELASLPRVLAHRDYHSRNVMILPGRNREMRILDFQDARMGNIFYDLASLFRDSYVTLDEKTVDHLSYVYRHAAPADLKRMGGDRSAFPRRLDLAALQRNIKAIGTFGNQAREKGKNFYLRFIPPTVAHIRANFERNTDLRPLERKLMPILDSLSAKAEAECGRSEGGR